ncbi:MAG: GerW family sporulation protein [Oscillospiraceae bacterium]
MKELLKVLEFTADRTQALADSQSVAGEPLHVGDVTLIPVSSISCGFAGGGSDLPARTRNDAAAAGSGARLAKTPVAFLAVCGQEVQVLTLEQPAKEEKSLLAQLAPLAEKVRQAAAEKKAAKAEEALPAKTGKRSLVDAPAACAAYQKPRRVRCPQAAKKIRSFSPAACTSEKIPLSPPVCKSPAFGGRFVRAADCDLFVGKAQRAFPTVF